MAFDDEINMQSENGQVEEVPTAAEQIADASAGLLASLVKIPPSALPKSVVSCQPEATAMPATDAMLGIFDLLAFAMDADPPKNLTERTMRRIEKSHANGHTTPR